MVYSKVSGEKGVLLLGGCEDVWANPLMAPWDPHSKAKRSKKHDKKEKSRIQKDESCWVTDFKLIEEYFVKIGCTICGSYPSVWRVTKEATMQVFSQFFQRPLETHIIYWSGHGIPETGNWCFAEDEEINLEEILDLYRKSYDPYTDFRTLVIVSDSCHSGKWCADLESREEFEMNVIIQAGSLVSEESFIVEGYKPRSLLMRKFIHDFGSTQESSFYWDNEEQHPNFKMSHALEEKKGMYEIEGSEAEVVCLYQGMRFSTILESKKKKAPSKA